MDGLKKCWSIIDRTSENNIEGEFVQELYLFIQDNQIIAYNSWLFIQ